VDAALYGLIYGYLLERAQRRGDSDRSFRLSSIRAYAAQHPSRYPEFVADSARVRVAVDMARNNGEILPASSGGRDDLLWLRRDFAARNE